MGNKLLFFVCLFLAVMFLFSRSYAKTDAQGRTVIDTAVSYANDTIVDTGQFKNVVFRERVDLRGAYFSSEVTFHGIEFHGPVNLSAYFPQKFRFEGIDFFDSVFCDGYLHGDATFSHVIFHKPAFFYGVQFQPSLPDSLRDTLQASTKFTDVQFLDTTSFEQSEFAKVINFESTIFRGPISFSNAIFFDTINCEDIEINQNMMFNGAYLHSLMRFSKPKFLALGLSAASIDFSDSRIFDKIIMDESVSFDMASFDFSRSIFMDKGNSKRDDRFGGRVILNGPASLKLQLEQFSLISFGDRLDYFTKKEITNELKDWDFPDSKRYAQEHFELNFIFEKSTKYQRASVDYETYPWYHPMVGWRWLYYWTMGLGYRPFWLIYWALGLLILFGVIFMFKLRYSIYNFVHRDNDSKKLIVPSPRINYRLSKWDTIVNCLYFSASVLFTFRLNRNILTHFTSREKRWIVAEWLLGFVIYTAFLLGSKAGSILQNLKSLFIG